MPDPRTRDGGLRRAALRPVVVLVALAALAGAFATAPAAHAVKRRAFVTSIRGSGRIADWPGAAGATVLDQADAVCRALAADADPLPLPNAASYRAWLSTSTTDGYCHIQGLDGTETSLCDNTPGPGAGPWYLSNGSTPFTASLDLLTSEGEIYRSILRDENGAAVPLDTVERRYWTGTRPNGTSSLATCQDFTSGANADTGITGDARAGAIAWTNSETETCDVPQRLLCLEPGASDTTPLSWSPGAIVFLTSETGSGKLSTWPSAGGFSGVSAGYEICRQSAETYALPRPGSFVPWLSTTFLDARERVTGDGPFRRIDGVVVAGDRDDLADGLLVNGIWVHQDGSYASSGEPWYVWTGTAPDGSLGDFNCDNWDSDSTGQQGVNGHAGYGPANEWTTEHSYNCSSAMKLYCISNVVTLFWDGFELTGDSSRWSSIED